MTSLEIIQQPVAAELTRYREAFEATLQHQNPLLQKALEHILQRRGKLLRPTLVFLCARLVGEPVSDRVMDVALALELLHTASLIHDDVVDESDKRRGVASVNALMTNQVAVLVGDFVLSRSLYHAAKTGDARVVEIVAGLGQSLADGELLQLHNVDVEAMDEKSYYEVISKKTACLFSVCAQLGVLAADGPEDLAERMRQFGCLTGNCFQLRDDIFDFEEDAQTGKPVGNDMKEGKLTLPAIYVLTHHADEELLRKAHLVRTGEATQQDIADLVAYTREKGGLDYARWAMDEVRMMADGLIDDSREPAIAEALHRYVRFATERKF